MFKRSYFFLILFVFCIISCTKQKEVTPLSDQAFKAYISNDDFRDSIEKIDSLITNGEHTSYRKTLLFNEKGRLLGHLEKDIEAIGSLK